MSAAKWKRLFAFSGFKLGLLLTLVFVTLKALGDVNIETESEHAWTFLTDTENSVLDLKVLIRGGPRSAEDRAEFQRQAHVVIVAVDEKSLRMPELGMWPWPRNKIADLISQLNRCGSKVIGFDMVFSEPDAARIEPVVAGIAERYRQLGREDEFGAYLDRTLAEVSGDQIMAQVLEGSKNVVLGYFFFQKQEEVDMLGPEEQAEIRRAVDSIGFGTFGYEVQHPQSVPERCLIPALGARANLPQFTEAVEHYGFFNQMSDRDGVYRSLPMVSVYSTRSVQGYGCVETPERIARLEADSGPDTRVDFFPSLSLQVISSFLGQPAELLLNTMDTAGESLVPGFVGIFLGPLGVPGPEHVMVPVELWGRFRLNFYGPQRTFRHVSAGDIIRGESQACQAVRDKIVLVGATSVGIYDLRPTPFEANYPGVELHATAIENILTGNFLERPLGFSMWEWVAMLLLGVVFSFVLTRLRLTVGAAITLVCLVGLWLADYFLLFQQGLWAHGVLQSVHMLCLFMGIAVYRYATEEREKSKVRHAFQFYLAPDVIDQVLQDTTRLKLGGERRELTVLFSDIRGFTTISEGLAPEALTELLNEYLTPMTEIVFSHNGTLDKYMGDAIMAFFGAPVPFADHARTACRSALAMMEELERLRAGWQQRGLPALDIGIGVNTGPMSVGNMGSARRFDYTVMGDHVNLGSRLEGLNKQYGTHVLISQFTRAQIGDHFTCRELDRVAVKGKHEPVTLYELVHRGPPQPEEDGWIARFEGAVVTYRERRFAEALAVFEELLSSRGDKPSRLYMERCRELLATPPAADWDGVYRATTK